MADKLLSEKKSSTNYVEKGTDEWADIMLSEKKSLTKNVEKGTDKLSDTILIEKTSSTFDVDKGTDEMVFMKQKVNTIRRKVLNQFEGQSTGFKGWFKPDIKFFLTFFSKIHSEIYKALFKNNIEYQDMEVYKTFLVPFDEEFIKKKIEKQKLNMIFQSEAPAPE